MKQRRKRYCPPVAPSQSMYVNVIWNNFSCLKIDLQTAETCWSGNLSAYTCVADLCARYSIEHAGERAGRLHRQSLRLLTKLPAVPGPHCRGNGVTLFLQLPGQFDWKGTAKQEQALWKLWLQLLPGTFSPPFSLSIFFFWHTAPRVCKVLPTLNQL